MTANSCDHSAAALAVPFEHHARQALLRAVIHYGMDHPVVDAALQSVLGIRQVAGIEVAGIEDGGTFARAACPAATP